jgi:hypothetical protein
LKKDFSALANIKGKIVIGKWSVIYAQSLFVELENGLRFVTNFKFMTKPDISMDPLSEINPLQKFEWLDNHDSFSFISDCGATMVGVVQDKQVKDSMKKF